MNKKDIKKFQEILIKRKAEIIASADTTKEEGMGFDPDDLPDEVDLASTEAGQSLNLRLRDRERVLLKKINEALKKIDDGAYGICEECGEDISIERLLARPVADYCVRCKEEQEKREKLYAE
ncbi:MAG: RNA polymerase-binding protein DksA [Deltaproteobacteria bacterium CG_4_10_14_0_2_um_filter_43_8]|nr:MAG: RNA polymerase-binding protein DksA [Deltaproteobacteria bacterium CG11_big_fil_rev_8_21_14_0_20_49_13]PJA19505.1 MAG: RNA polymerase-binding protein DksA [Deltaproteobacteria bacterium CG_4_10_14_0_2_um_filter_43_8]